MAGGIAKGWIAASGDRDLAQMRQCRTPVIHFSRPPGRAYAGPIFMAPSLMPDTLRFSPQATESDLRQAVIQCGRICYDRHLFTANDGNISVRLPDHRFLITPSGISKGRMDPDDLLVIDSEGRVSEARADLQPSSETPMHLEAYRQLPEVRSVIHAHPVFPTTLTVAGFDFPS